MEAKKNPVVAICNAHIEAERRSRNFRSRFDVATETNVHHAEG